MTKIKNTWMRGFLLANSALIFANPFGISTRRPNPVNLAYAEKLGIELDQVVSALAGEEPCSEILNDMRARQIIIKHRVYEWRADKEAKPVPSKLPPAL